MRILASIQKIKNIESISNADAIEKATVLGWQLVVKKNEFKVGDLCVYIEIDSILPQKEVFEFLRNKNFRIKTMKLRGQISQGICFPLSVLPSNVKIEEGNDVTNELEIIKYEPKIPVELNGIMKAAFPSFIPKTDETRVQVLQHLLDEYKGKSFYVTEKLDGTSATFFVYNNEFGVCSRNMELEKSETNTFWKVALELNIEEKLRLLNKNVAIQAELVGPSIQSNKLALSKQTIFVFNLFYIDEFKYATYKELISIVKNEMKLNVVPIFESNYVLENNIETLLEKAKIKSTLNEKVDAEGIVLRCNNSENHISFKAINNNFLLKYDD